MADWAETGTGVAAAVAVSLVVPQLGLRAFQNPTGADMARLAGATHELSEEA